MESFSNDIHAILSELNDSERQADELISSFQSRFDKVLQKFIVSKATTPVRPTKKKLKGRIEKLDSLDDSFSSTNSTQSRSTVDSSVAANTVALTETTITGNQTHDVASDESQFLRPVRTGRAKALQSYKEPALNSKMRRDNDQVVVKIKTERPSVVPNAEKPKTAVEAESKRVTRIKKEKVDDATSSANSSPVEPVTNGTKNKKTSQASSNDSLEIVPMETNPPIELSDDDSRNDGDKMPPPAIVPQTKSIKEKKAPAEKKVRSTRSKQPKRTKIKEEPMSESEDEIMSIQTKASSSKIDKTTVQEAQSKKKSVESTSGAEKTAARGLNVSEESNYEDAVADQINKPTLSQQSDATFVTTADECETAPLSPRGTYVIPGNQKSGPPNETFNMTKASSVNDKTTLITKSKTATATTSANSLMTDDDSDNESLYQKRLNMQKKDPQELFNPCASNPIKQRVEAFEKLQTPHKETRAKTRGDGEQTSKAHVALHKAMSNLELTSKNTRTASATRQGTQNKTALTKSQSVEEIRKRNQAVADDKKKKQDDKLRKAQQMREAQEKEKLEKQRKLLEEKEQRAREKQQLKQQEEALKAAEQKRKEAEREQKRKEALAKKAAAERKEQEHYLRVLAEKKAMQEKLRLNKIRAEEAKKKNPYHFDMLDSGDSTDEEAKVSTKKPSPPTWSLSQYRKPNIFSQSKANTKVIDKFFSVAPLEVDLREIFPKIDEKHLRRNSSAVWNSPPRYSMLPKY